MRRLFFASSLFYMPCPHILAKSSTRVYRYSDAKPVPPPSTQSASSFAKKHSRYAALGPKVNWRIGPEPDQDILFTYESPGWPVIILKKFENWYKVMDFLGTKGWVKGSMLRFKPTLLILKDAILYANPNSTARKRAKLLKGVIVRYVKSTDSVWLYVMIPEKNLRGWIQSHAAWPKISAP